jgi:L-histidine N-alpha-methyltransferase
MHVEAPIPSEPEILISDTAVPGDEDASGRLRFARDVALGLSDTPRWLPSEYLYDAEGSGLFEEITRLPEYYPTRTEAAILHTAADGIAKSTGPVTVIELGSGSSRKTSLLIDAYTATHGSARYVPVDVSAAAVRGAERRFAERHPDVEFAGIVGKYEEAFPLFREHAPSMVVFLGSTIGNFNHGESLRFWRQLSRSLDTGDFFLLGVDLVKDLTVLEAAYNDDAGVTAAFTRNLFARMNRELEAGVDLDAVEHVARYNPEWQRIEIFAQFTKAMEINVGPLGIRIPVEAGDRVMTEISRKFVLDRLEPYAGLFGFDVVERYTDDQEWFALLLLRRVDD